VIVTGCPAIDPLPAEKSTVCPAATGEFADALMSIVAALRASPAPGRASAANRPATASGQAPARTTPHRDLHPAPSRLRSVRATIGSISQRVC
jgi:hypothetical protein